MLIRNTVKKYNFLNLEEVCIHTESRGFGRVKWLCVSRTPNVEQNNLYR